MELIDKSKLLEGLKKLKQNLSASPVVIIEDVESLVEIIDVKEVDLDGETRRYRMRNPIIQHREESLYDYMTNVAKHFFELGLKAQKGE